MIMTTMNIILVIYISGLIFNFGTVFNENMNNDPTVKDNCKFIALSFLSWMLWPLAYIYQSFAKKQERKNLGI